MICKLNFIVLFLSSILITNTGNAQAGSSPSRTETKTARAFYTASNQSHGPMDATVTLEYSFFREYIGGKYFLGISIHYKNMEYSTNYGGYRYKLNGKIYTQQELQSYDSRGVECFTDVIINRVTIRDLGITGVSKKITYSGAINRFDGLVEISKTQDLNNFSLITATSTCSDIGYKQDVDCVSKRINDFEKGVKNVSDYKIAIQKADQAFLSKDWTRARQYYRQASAMFPNENYPIDQLEKIKQKEKEAQQAQNNTQNSGSNSNNSSQGSTGSGSGSQSGSSNNSSTNSNGSGNNATNNTSNTSGSSINSYNTTNDQAKIKSEKEAAAKAETERNNKAIAQDAIDKNNKWAQDFNDRIDAETEKSKKSAQLAQQSYYTLQTLRNAESDVNDNMHLSGNYTTPEELEAEFNRKQAALNQSIADLAEAQNKNLQANYNTYSPYRDEKTEAIGQLAVGVINLINNAQVEKEKRIAQQQLQQQKTEALAEMERQKKAMRLQLRKDVFEQFPEGGVPMSSHRISTDDLYFFVYNFDDASIEDGRPKIAMSNVFPIAKYGDGTWPFKSVVVGEIQKIHKTGKTTLVGYYTTKEMADGMRASFIRMAVKSEMTIEDFVYKGRPRNNSSTSSSVDFWGNSGNAKKPNPSTENNTQTDFWDNPVKSSTTQPNKPIEKKPEPAKPKLDFWGNPIK